VRALVVVPSQELAVQVHGVFELMTRGTVLSVGLVCGRVPIESEQAMLWARGVFPPCSKVDVLIATPGRLVEHMDRY
jgi:superfamily II DNA/RNA helicase